MRSSCAISRRKRLICWLVTSMPPCFTLIWRHSRRHNNWRRRVSASEPGLVVPVAIIGNSSAHVMVLRLKLDKENAKRKSVPGRYIYTGSRRTKVERWHIDQLTKTGACGAWRFPGYAMNAILSSWIRRCRFQLLDSGAQTVSVVTVIYLGPSLSVN
jgi:hypothetical protein